MAGQVIEKLLGMSTIEIPFPVSKYLVRSRYEDALRKRVDRVLDEIKKDILLDVLDEKGLELQAIIEGKYWTLHLQYRDDVLTGRAIHHQTLEDIDVTEQFFATYLVDHAEEFDDLLTVDVAGNLVQWQGFGELYNDEIIEVFERIVDQVAWSMGWYEAVIEKLVKEE